MPDDFDWREEFSPEELAKAREGVEPNGHAGADDHLKDNNIWEMDDEPIPPRGWLLGNTFCREFLSAVIADGGVGKTALRIVQYLSCTTGRKLTGEHVFVRSRVLVICLEDGKKELKRRLRAAMLHYGITSDEIKGWLFLWTPKGLRLMEADSRGKPILGDLDQQVRQKIKTLNIDLVGIDPFIKSHSVDENDNSAMDKVAGMLATLAQEHNIASDIAQHTRKGPSDPGNADLGRGASAVKDAARIVDTIMPMSKDEAATFNISEQERKVLIRVDNAKANLTPKAADARWFRLVGVRLGNRNDTYPHGDEVQTIECWTAPDLFGGLTTAKVNEILDKIDLGLPDGGRYSDSNAAKKRAAWKVVCELAPDKNEKQARSIIATWKTNGVLISTPYHDPERREDIPGLSVDPTKRPGPR